jgi:hypothetical protein
MSRANIVIAFCILGIGVVWLGLSTFGVDHRAVEAIRPWLPKWFALANLFVAPLLVALAVGPLRVHPKQSIGLVVVTLISISMLYLSHASYPRATIADEVGIWLEAFVIFPAWNRRRHLHELRKDGMAWEKYLATRPRLGVRLRSLALYVVIAVLLTSTLTLYVLQRGQRSKILFPPQWTWLIIGTAFMFGYYLQPRNWQRPKFWKAYLSLLSVHIFVWVLLLAVIRNFQIDWFVFFALCEWVTIGASLDWIVPKTL